MPGPTIRSNVSSDMPCSIARHDHGCFGSPNLYSTPVVRRQVWIKMGSAFVRSTPHRVGTPSGCSLVSRSVFSAVLLRLHSCGLEPKGSRPRGPSDRMSSLVMTWLCHSVTTGGCVIKGWLRHHGDSPSPRLSANPNADLSQTPLNNDNDDDDDDVIDTYDDDYGDADAD